MANPRLFVLDMKFKSRWKMNALQTVLGVAFVLYYISMCCEASTKCGSSVCDFGVCTNGTCRCLPGWTGQTCGHCVGRVRLTKEHGFISDGTGNYTVDSKCAWLVDTGERNQTIRFHLEEFATECGWDHIFIHDGDSAFSPLRAAYSGRMVVTNASHSVMESRSETVVYSGKAYVHFYSDAAYSIAGFNISYRFGECPKNCSGHGKCHTNATVEECVCTPGWGGSACDQLDCINSSSPCSIVCMCEQYPDRPDCVVRQRAGYWEPVGVENPPHPRTSHRSVVLDNFMWVVGGYNFNLTPFQTIIRYDFDKNIWESIQPLGGVIPANRFGHTLVGYQNNLYMYGGVIGGTVTDELYLFNTTSAGWTHLDMTSVHVSADNPWNLPVVVTGHTAHVVDDIMVVIFGHSPTYGYMHNVQEYSFASGGWKMVSPTGALVKGTYGHSSVYDEVSGLIYVFGGSSRETKDVKLSDQLIAYDARKKHWSLLKGSGSPRYLHSAVLLNDTLLVFGGNTHDTSEKYSTKCYSSDLLAYDMSLDCDYWKFLTPPSADTVEKLARYGHSSVVYKGEVYIFGGFSGVMMNDIYKYTPGNCTRIQDKTECETDHPGVQCKWSDGQCVLNINKTCPDISKHNCSEFRLCVDCHASLRECHWCENECSNKVCSGESPVMKSCKPEYSHRCNQIFNCELCKTENNCKWNGSNCNYVSPLNSTSHSSTSAKCSAPCDSHISCDNCTKAKCMWCTNLERCVETNSYTASFPYGICQEWSIGSNQCSKTMCGELKTCDECHSNPRCGWCNSPNNTGLGMCMEGGDSGDLEKNCPDKRWFFTSCPLCQCNGHSQCKNGTNNCVECQSYTTGPQCGRCKSGYFGDAKFGGYCKPCACNGQTDMCNTETGDCYCRTKGITGTRCERCDDGNKYHGNATTGTCYYTLATDYQYTFDLSKKSDTHLTQINFVNIPEAADRDVDFTVNCSSRAMINITWNSRSYPEEQLVMSPVACGFVKRKFEHKSYNFVSSENTTFRIYVYDFKTPFWLQLTISQQPQIDLAHFFLTFLSCFLGLMLLAALLWKFKQKYEMYRRRQRMVVELEQMASRPFASVSAEIEPKIDPYNGPGALAMKREPPDVKRKKIRSPNKPFPIAYEPLSGSKVAVISMLVRLPTGDEDFTPPGQCGLAIASALITLGNQRKPSLEKGDKSKLKKHTQLSHPDTCI
ncbi:LOW QUALITY PROTEIN: attractin-like protein 1 [Liolophura sinensis]|uniref:LOW QUALITY PROTEIN: attractin-like protein 1 n=1 Tax=Liolophura sinensis TaxID=3198878 RepID=UPI00315981DE